MDPKKILNITQRQAKIFGAIVKEYSQTAQPIGSEEINKKYGFDISSATIRNEMMALERAGLIEQPHTSAGRVPTDLGYRYFVNELMKRFELSLKEQKFLRSQLQKLQKQNEIVGRDIAKLLAKQTDQAAFAIFPDESSSAGIANILLQPNQNSGKIVEVVEFFENIDEYSRQLTSFLENKPGALIGKEHHLPQISNYSMIVSRVALPSGKKGIIGILGPKSMRYDKNMTLLEYVAKTISSSALVTLIFITQH